MAAQLHPAPDPLSVTYGSHGSAVWHDLGELLLTLAMAYPELDSTLQVSVTQYVSDVIALYPPWENMPYGEWLDNSAPAEPCLPRVRRPPPEPEQLAAAGRQPPLALRGLAMGQKHGRLSTGER